MCGRITLPETKTIVKELKLKYDQDHLPGHINLPPTLKVPLITNTKPGHLQYFTWSLIPAFSKTGKPDFKMSTFNGKLLNNGMTLLNHPLALMIKSEDRAKFTYKPEEHLIGKYILVTGKLIDYKGKAEIIVNQPSQIRIIIPPDPDDK